ncbi:MAG: DsbA family protein [Candidatus Planktophila sp.]
MSSKTPKGPDNTTRNLVIGMVVLVVAVGAIFSVLSNKENTSAALPSSVSKADGYGIVFNGDLTGVPVVDIWEDFQCPVCARFEQTNSDYLEKIIQEKKAKVVFHTLSFLGPESSLTANAAACASDEDKFLGFHKAFYQNQPAENSGVVTTDYLVALGQAVGITSDKFKNCVTNLNYKGWVNNVAASGGEKNINSTPTVFVNGKEIRRSTSAGDLGDYFDPAAFAKAVEGK